MIAWTSEMQVLGEDSVSCDREKCFYAWYTNPPLPLHLDILPYPFVQRRRLTNSPMVFCVMMARTMTQGTVSMCARILFACVHVQKKKQRRPCERQSAHVCICARLFVYCTCSAHRLFAHSQAFLSVHLSSILLQQISK